jgi:hypothetical protein
VNDESFADASGPDDAQSLGASIETIAWALRSGIVPNDRAFDRFLPSDLRVISRQYWTQLCAVVRVAEWLKEIGVRSVVDIGSGAGKFCVAGALATECEFVGMEQRAGLVAVARDLARSFQVDDRVRFLQGTFGVDPTPEADAYYMYNPFGENLFGCDARLGEGVELGGDRYHRDVRATQRWLARVPLGTHLITYNGFGGRMPPGYREIALDREQPNLLRMWRKVSDTTVFVASPQEGPESP